ncbi:MAG: hypothetical protein Q9206_001378 [Seirophora lacunosa]
MARNDVYLSLCLEQASLSPLHYRHGCIVVRGGKVIGKGYNDYRSGFNGGARSTGRLSSAGASNALRAKKLGKRSAMAKNTSKHTLIPSAESLRSRPPRQSAVAGPTPQSLVLKPLHLNYLQLYPNDSYSVEEEEEEEEKATNVSKRRNLANNNVHHHGQPDHLNTHKTNSWKARQPTSDNSEKHRKQYLYGLSDGNQYRHHGRHEETQNSTHQHQQHEQQHGSSAVVMPQHRVLTKSHQTAERMKDSRLNGADLYVARLGKRGKADHFDCGCRHDRSSRADDRPVVEKGSEQHSTDLESSAKTSLLTGSLHEELRFPLPKEKSEPLPQSIVKEERLTATHSKPCYRCISYMHSAGIKRVFWTNHDGQWEGGKVRDLVDALEGPASPYGKSREAAPVAGSVYVTKSEVLLLKGLK